MTYNYKYRDNEGNPAPSTLVVDGRQVLNPNAEMYAQCGYTPYVAPQPTEEELAEQARMARIAKLHQLLDESDYKAIKYAEGWISAADYADIKAQRQAWRDEINELEQMTALEYLASHPIVSEPVTEEEEQFGYENDME